MQIAFIFLLLIVMLNGFFVIRLVQDCLKNWQDIKLDPASAPILMISSPIIFFCSALGISDFTLATLFYRKMNFLNDKKLPGTLNTQCVIPVAVMAVAFISVIAVDTTTLLVCIIAQMLGAHFGPRIMVKFSLKTIRLIIGLGMLSSMFFILAGKFNLMPYGGVENGLDHLKLLIAAASLMTFGALNSLGIGSYTPTLVTLYILGLNPLAAFPIIMGASAFSVPLSSIQYIKYNLYSRKITLIAGLFGVVGAAFGVHFLHTLDLSKLQWLLVVILFYSSSSLLINEFKTYKSSAVIRDCKHAQI